MRRRGRWIAGLALALLVALVAFPFYWALVASITPEARLFAEPSLWPEEPVLDHYRALWDERDFWVPIRNSLIVAGTTTFVCVSIGSLAAWALARLRFRGKHMILGGLLAVSLFPQISLVCPLFLLLRSLRLIDTYPGLILPYLTFAMPLAVWLLTSFFRQLPPDLEEAGARDDRHPHLHLLLERVPLRPLLHPRPRAPDRPGRHRPLPRPVPGPLGPDPRRRGRGDGPGGVAGPGVPAEDRAGADGGGGEGVGCVRDIEARRGRGSPK